MACPGTVGAGFLRPGRMKATADGVSSAVAFGLGVVVQCLGLGGVSPEVVLCEAGARSLFAVLLLCAALFSFLDSRLPIAVGASLLRGGVAAVRGFGQLESELEGYASRTRVGGARLLVNSCRLMK